MKSLLIRKVNTTCGIDYSKRPFSKNSYHTETSQMICNTNQASGFYTIRIFTERSDLFKEALEGAEHQTKLLLTTKI